MALMQNILVPIDFSEHSAAAYDLAIELAKALGGRLQLLHCYQINPGAISPYGLVLPESLDRGIREAASKRLDEWAQKAAGAGVKVTTGLSPLFPSLAIVDTARDTKADLIVMGTRGLSGIKHVLLGSVAERTLREAPCPVLTIKDEAAA